MSHKTPIKFLKEFYWQKHCQLRLKGTETIQEEKKPLDLQKLYRQKAG